MAQILCSALVGRASELETAARLLDTDRGGALAVVGEAGIGKSRFLGELVRRARSRELLVVDGRAGRTRQSTAYGPLAEALVRACRRVGLPDDPELIPYRPVLGRLIPEWFSPASAAASESAVLVGEGVLRMLNVLGAGRGAVLTVEDLQWADPDTLAVMEYVIDHAREERLAIWVSARPGPSMGSGLVRELIARRAAVVVDLGPLSAAEVVTMARSALGTSTLPVGLSRFLARADGVPFLVEELLSAAAESGVLQAENGGWRVDALDEVVVPRTFADSVRQRVESLTQDDQELVHIAALMDRLDPTVLGSALGRPSDEVVGVLTQCVELQLVVADGAGFRFRHALTRDAVLAGLPPQLRAILARRAREVLATVHPDLPGPWCELAAELSVLGGNPADAARLLLIAGQRALEAGALTTAGAILGRARSLADADAEVVGDIDELRVEVASRAGDAATAFEIGNRLVGSTSDPARRARMHVTLAQAAIAAAEWTVADRQLTAARRFTRDSAQLVGIDALRADMSLGAARAQEAAATARSVLARATRPDLAESACHALEVLGRATRYHDLARAEKIFARQLKVASAGGLAMWAARATHELGTVDLMRANAIERLTRARQMALEGGDLTSAATIDCNGRVPAGCRSMPSCACRLPFAVSTRRGGCGSTSCWPRPCSRRLPGTRSPGIVRRWNRRSRRPSESGGRRRTCKPVPGRAEPCSHCFATTEAPPSRPMTRRSRSSGTQRRSTTGRSGCTGLFCAQSTATVAVRPASRPASATWGTAR